MLSEYDMHHHFSDSRKCARTPECRVQVLWIQSTDAICHNYKTAVGHYTLETVKQKVLMRNWATRDREGGGGDNIDRQACYLLVSCRRTLQWKGLTSLPSYAGRLSRVWIHFSNGSQPSRETIWAGETLLWTGQEKQQHWNIQNFSQKKKQKKTRNILYFPPTLWLYCVTVFTAFSNTISLASEWRRKQSLCEAMTWELSPLDSFISSLEPGVVYGCLCYTLHLKLSFAQNNGIFLGHMEQRYYHRS